MSMKLKTILGAGLAPIFLAACATTDTTSSDSKKLTFTGFTKQTDGGQFHGGTGLVCPPTLLGISITDKREYGSDATDASCSYRGDDKFVTVYLSKLNESFQSNFQGSVSSVMQGSLGETVEFDEEATKTCQLGGLLMAAVSPSEGASSDKTDLYPFETAVFSSEKLVTIVQLTEVETKFLKLRYTLLDKPKSEGLNACIEGSKALRDVYNLTQDRGQL